MMGHSHLVQPPDVRELGTGLQQRRDDLAGPPGGIRRVRLPDLRGKDPAPYRMVLDGVQATNPRITGEPTVDQVTGHARVLGVVTEQGDRRGVCSNASPSRDSTMAGTSERPATIRVIVGPM